MSKNNNDKVLKITDIKPLGINLREEGLKQLNQSDKVFKELINEYEEEEKQKYKEIVKKAIKEYNDIVKELNDIEGDIPEEYNETGIEEKGRRYSKALVEKINTKKNRANLLFTSLYEAKDKKNYKALDKLYK